MMVILISQCQKNALKKTRRVLDAFADRIGNNTWQTVITEEGLEVVKKLLQKTASKNTAVSCHWIRSRARSEFLWVVGNKDEFNATGIVPVNYTNKKLILDEAKIMTEKNYANQKKQSLEQHLFAVGYLSSLLIMRLLNDEKLSKAAFVSGCLHDIGKLDPEFQSWINAYKNEKVNNELSNDGQHIDKGSFTWENYPRHNEISLLIYQFFDDAKYLGNKEIKSFVEHTIYWHHAKPIRKDDFDSLNWIYKKFEPSLIDKNIKLVDFFSSVKVQINAVNSISINYTKDEKFKIQGIYNKIDDDILFDLKKKPLPKYKEYEAEDLIDKYQTSVNLNAKKNILRAVVITADRLISELQKEQLAENIKEKKLHLLLDKAMNVESNLSDKIQKSLQLFESTYPDSDRNIQQREAAKKLANTQGVAVLNGPAGCGKTKIALEWAKNTGVKKIIWVCPRVQVCEGLFQDLTSKEYLSESLIEICTSEFKEVKKGETTVEGKEFSGDVVLTTIDQIINSIITHRNVTSLIDFMETHVVFDEYHEYINMPAFNLLFSELVQCKRLQVRNTKTLLVSATPNYFFLKNLLKIDQEDVIGIKSFNQNKYRISFQIFDETKQDDFNPLFSIQHQNSIVISNTATTAQLSFIKNQTLENAALFHSKFTKKDKAEIFNKIFFSFKQNGSRVYDTLRSGPIVQASLNITCENMVTEFTNAENWLQRLGRLDRFGENKNINQYVTALPQTLAEGKRNGFCAKFLSSFNVLHSAMAWYQFIENNLSEQPIVTISYLYQLYENFYASEIGKKSVKSDLIASLKKSVAIINEKVHDPISFPKKKVPKDSKNKLKKSSLRGDNRFVEMAICNILVNGDFVFPDKYACYETSDFFTMSLNEIEGYGSGGDKNLINFMYDKHHKILSAKTKEKHTKKFKPFLLKNEAIDIDHPIYVSYTQEDLNLCHDKPSPNAIYYAVSEKQSIGAISINKLSNQKINE